ncbi:TIGR03086 family protein [Rhodococcus spelaei]|uniref:TIGR03086 family protein n=1 Tax=Rhodococcus spelaei TaxID=2546320 RepID=A0A541AZ64_9NOCA|nr:TIGR03086 family metal-binding protein [Rhodococcus spelaei]TQF65360.1 TIGR03086 family protein [Rhodococcus spelaei]
MRTITELDKLAVQAGVDVVRQIAEADLLRPTPCEGWNLRDLLDHMTVQHNGFAAAARGSGGDLAVWRTGTDRVDPIGDYTAAADAVIAAFAPDDILERAFTLPEISPTGSFPGSVAIGFHLVDYVVHGWDVAATLGLAYEPAPEVTAAAMRVAELVPNGPERLVTGAAFAPALTTPDAEAPLHRVLRLLGRSPDWTA